MSRFKVGIVTALSALGLFAGAAYADPIWVQGQTVVAQPVVRVRWPRARWNRVRYRYSYPYTYGQYGAYGQYGTYGQYGVQPVYQQTPVYNQTSDCTDPALFAEQIRAEMNVVDADIRYHVQAGSMDPSALASLNAGRDEIERDLAEAMAKGYITEADRQHLEQHVQELRDLRERYRAAQVVTPGYYGTEYPYGQ